MNPYQSPRTGEPSRERARRGSPWRDGACAAVVVILVNLLLMPVALLAFDERQPHFMETVVTIVNAPGIPLFTLIMHAGGETALMGEGGIFPYVVLGIGCSAVGWATLVMLISYLRQGRKLSETPC